MNDVVTLRRAGTDDVPLLVDLRVRATLERYAMSAAERGAYASACRRSIAAALATNDLRVWLAFEGGDVAGVAMLIVSASVLPQPHDLQPRRGRVHNVYVVPGSRRRGIASALMRLVIAEAKAEKLERLMLGTSEQGRPLYEKLGFVYKRDEMVYREES
jgi:ribosomal protein S18 acetylase RimI-like enzyme